MRLSYLPRLTQDSLMQVHITHRYLPVTSLIADIHLFKTLPANRVDEKTTQI